MAATTPTALTRFPQSQRAGVAALIAGALALSACGGSGGGPTALAAAPVTTAAPTVTSPPPSLAAATTSPAVATSAPAAIAATASTAPASTTIPLPRQLTTPIAPPLDTRAAEPVIEMGRIAIPKIAVDSVMYEGIRLSTLDYGPGHWPGSALPGQIGNVVVAGHRTSKHQVFRHLDDLVAGDEIRFTDENGEHAYRVSSVEIVGPDAIWIIDPTDTPTLTLFACHPPGSTAERIVVHADLVV